MIIGVLIYALFIRGRIFRKEGENYVFLNPSLSWFNIEENFYKPASRHIYVIFGKIFKVLDNWVLHLAGKSVEVFAAIGEIDVSYFDRFKFEKVVFPSKEENDLMLKDKMGNAMEKGSQVISDKGSQVRGKFENVIDKGSQTLSEKRNQVRGKLEDSVDKKGKSIKESLNNANFKISSLTYSVFLFGIVLVISFIFIFLKNGN